MIGLDTNVVVRYLAQDDELQSGLANEVIDAFTEAEPGFVSLVVLCETSWVLARAYGADRDAVAGVMQGLLESKELMVEHPDTVRRAVRRMAGGADFADAVIAEVGSDATCEATVTFDRRAARSAGMRLLE